MGSKRSRRRRKQKRKTLAVQVKDPVAELSKRMDDLERENAQLMNQLKLYEEQLADGFEDTTEHTDEMIRKAQRGMTKEDLAKARGKALADLQRKTREAAAEIEREAKRIYNEQRLSWTPPVTDVIPYGGFVWPFKAGVEGKYPRALIELYKQRQRGLADWQALKGAYGGALPGEEMVAIEYEGLSSVGTVLRDPEEHAARLAAAGIEQGL